MNLSARHRNIIRLLGILLLAIVIVGVVVIAAPYVAPLLAGLIVYLIAKPLARLLHGKLRVNNYVTAALCMLLIVGLLAVLLTVLIVNIVNEIQSLVETFPVWSQTLYNWLDSIFDFLQERLDLLHPSISDTIDSAIRSVIAWLTTFVSSLASRTIIVIAGIPQALIFAVASVFCAFMFIADHDKIKDFFARHTPESWLKTFYDIRDGLFSALFGYVRAQLVMLVITFAELLLAFTILGMDYAMLLALTIALVDMLPVFGAGLFLIPWTLYSFVTGNIFHGVGLGILYAMTIIVRQSVEPRLIGRNIGVYPVLTLVAMYAGLRLWGVFGLILGPVTVIVVKNVVGYMMEGMTFKEYLNHDHSAHPDAGGGEGAQE